jgi:hypothetical protein
MGFSGGGADKINFDAMSYANQANDILDKALERALPYSEMYSQMAEKDLRRVEADAKNQLEKYWEISQAQTAPYREAGYRALDQYQDTLGMYRPAVSSSQMAHIQENMAKKQGAMKEREQAVSSWLDQYDMKPAERANALNAIVNSSNPQGIIQGLDNWMQGNPQMDPYSMLQQQTKDSQLVKGKDGQYTQSTSYKTQNARQANQDLGRLPFGRMMDPAFSASGIQVDPGLRGIIPMLMSTGNTIKQANYNLPQGSSGIAALLNSGVSF